MKTILLLAALLLGSVTFANTNVEITAKTTAVDEVSAKRAVDQYAYNFGYVRVYTRQYVSYTLTNTGTTPLTFSRAMIGGAGFDAYHTCNGVILPSQKCSFDIIFQPMSEFHHNGRFILSFMENLDIVVDVYGIGTR